MRLGGFHEEGESNHAIGEEEIEVTCEVAVNVNIWIKEKTVNFSIHFAIMKTPGKRCLDVPVKASVPVSAE